MKVAPSNPMAGLECPSIIFVFEPVTARDVDLSTKTRHWEKTGLSVASTELLRRFEVRTALKKKIQIFWVFLHSVA